MKKIELEIVENRYNFGVAKQNRHFNLVKLLNNYSQFKDNIEYQAKIRRTETAEEFLTVEEINKAVVVFTDILNLNNGSDGHVDLYRLLQTYLLDKEKRKKINLHI